jgi:hypothetical protein
VIRWKNPKVKFRTNSPSIEGATGKANGLPVFLLIMVVEPFFSLLAGCF